MWAWPVVAGNISGLVIVKVDASDNMGPAGIALHAAARNAPGNSSMYLVQVTK
jgi:hypothetical protein